MSPPEDMKKPLSGMSTRTEIQAMLDIRDSSELGSRHTETIDIDYTSDIITFDTIKYNRGLIQMFVELLANSIDNYTRESNSEFYEPQTYIKVELNGSELTISNNGTVIPIYKNEQDEYDATNAFSLLRTGTGFNSFNKNTAISSIYGFGAKTVNIFSKSFRVQIKDSQYHKLFEQSWSDNKSKTSGPVVKSYRGKSSETRISYIPDFTRLLDEHDRPLTRYHDYDISMIKMYLIGASFTTGLNISLTVDDQTVKFGTKTFKSFIKLIDNYETRIDFSNEYLSFSLIESRDKEFHQLSYVNGILVSNGGSQVTYIMNKIHDIYKQVSKSEISSKEFTRNFTLVSDYRVSKPAFVEKFKGTYSKKMNALSSDDLAELTKQVKKLTKWSFAQQVVTSVKTAKQESDNLKRAKTHIIKGYTPVNGWPKTKNAILNLSEGDSAETFCKIGMVQHGNNNKHGLFKLGGKIMNMLTNTETKVLDNEVLNNLKTILNVRSDLDYCIKKNFDTLSYSQIWLATDADDDGYHICGLVITALSVINSSLLKVKGFLRYNATPLIITVKGLEFHTKHDYETYGVRNVNDKYYKGLGGFTNTLVKKYYAKNLIDIVYTDTSDDVIKLMFGPPGVKVSYHVKNYGTLYDRKDVANYFIYQGEKSIDYTSYNVTIDDILLISIAQYQNSANIRHLPTLIDGFKEGQRKTFYSIKKCNKLLKVAAYASRPTEDSNYSHGEQSVAGMIVKMAQTFPGSNNINLLYPEGQFGTITSLGKDAASPRYTYTRLDDIAHLIIRKEDDIVLKYKEDEGKLIEPEYYYPIIALIFMFNVLGIGMGFSCDIPCYSPFDVITFIRYWIHNSPMLHTFKMSPSYRGFNGTIEEVTEGKFISVGRFKRINSTTTIIQELPIGVSYVDYKDYLDELKGLVKEKKQLKEKEIDDYSIHTLDNGIMEFTITHSKPLDEKILKLTKPIKMNLTMFNSQGIIVKYDNPLDVLDEFCIIRQRKYIERYALTIKKLKADYTLQADKSSFTKAVVSGDFNIINRKTQTYYDYFKRQNYSESSYESIMKIPTSSYNLETVKRLENDMQRLTKQLNDYNNTTPDMIWLNELDELECYLIAHY